MSRHVMENGGGHENDKIKSTLLLVRIADTLTYINIEDMTQAEKKIAGMLEERNILIKSTTGDETVYKIYQNADLINL